jgi:indoleacetamide hydrolase
VSAGHDPARRRLLLGAAGAAAMRAARGVPLKGGAFDKPLADLGAAEAVALMSSGELRCEHYAEALLERCRSARALNAFITLEPERVLADARARDRERREGLKPGPLFGLPIPVKDSVNTRDYRTTGGTPALRNFRPSEDAPVIAALRHAGAIVLGKTNLHELSYGWTSNNLAFGAVHNPYDAARIPGGSSGGTGAAIAARLAPLGVAEDTEGSIRVPAAFCGIAGFRPTTGRYPTTGCVPISPLFDQVGPHARHVTDLLLFDAVAGASTAAATSPAAVRPAPSLRGTRLGVARDYWFEGLDPEVERITTAALKRLEQAGVVLVEAPLPGLAQLIDRVTDQIQNHDVRLALPRYLETYHAGVTFDQLVERASPDIRAVFKQYVLPGGADFVTGSDYADARDRYLPRIQQLYRNHFADTRVAAMVFPAVRVPPPLIGEETTLDVGGRKVAFEDAVARNIAPGSTAGLPGLVLPAGLTAHGLPVALEFDGPEGSDRELLTLGLDLERALGNIAPPGRIEPRRIG